jgi:hypothetical protein
LEKGLKKGLEKGRLEERAKADKLKFALELRKMGVAVEDIGKALGLTVEQVTEMKKDLLLTKILYSHSFGSGFCFLTRIFFLSNFWMISLGDHINLIVFICRY